MDMEERIAQLEFQVELLFNNADIDRLIFESKITREQYNAIMDLMDMMRSKIDNGEKVHHYEFEEGVYRIAPEKNGDYHFCELVAKLFAEERRWEEVFNALYGDMPKYKNMNMTN